MRSSVSNILTGLRFVALGLIVTAALAVIFPQAAQAGIEGGPNFDFYADGKGFPFRVVKPPPTQQIVSLFGTASSNYFTFGEALSVLKNIDPRKEIILDLSGFYGGYLSHAEDIVSTIKSVCEAKRNKYDRRQSCNITSFVDSNSSCISACIIPYMAAKKRVACDNTTFGFHAVSMMGFKGSAQYTVSLLLRLGVFKTWLLRNINMFRSLDVTYLTPREMIGSNIVTEVDPKCTYIDEGLKSAYESN